MPAELYPGWPSSTPDNFCAQARYLVIPTFAPLKQDGRFFQKPKFLQYKHVHSPRFIVGCFQLLLLGTPCRAAGAQPLLGTQTPACLLEDAPRSLTVRQSPSDLTCKGKM